MGDETLNKFGYNGQIKILTLLVTDRDFAKNMLDILESNLFESKAMTWISERTLAYFKEFKTCPTLDVFKIQIESIANNKVFQKEIAHTLQDVWKHIGADDLGFFKNESLAILRHRAIGKAITDNLKLLESEQYDEFIKRLIAANQMGQNTQNFGLDYLVDIDYRYTNQAQKEKIPTGFGPLDEVLNGGLDKGKFGVITAPTGVGKSWSLATIGAHALKVGKTVLHYTLELDDIYTAQRYDAIVTKSPFDNLKYNIPKVKNTLKGYEGKLFIKEFPPSTLSLQGLESHIEAYKSVGTVPDLVILDYPELMKIPFSVNMQDHRTLGEFYKDLRGLAGRMEFALWGADQVNRENSTKDIIGNEGISNSYAKLFALDVVASISRKAADKMQNRARFHLSKNRLGPDGMTFNMQFDTGTSHFEMYHAKSEKGQNITKQTQKDNEAYTEQLVQQRYQAVMNNNRTEPDNPSLF